MLSARAFRGIVGGNSQKSGSVATLVQTGVWERQGICRVLCPKPVATAKETGAIQLETPKAVPPFDFAQGGTAFGVSTFATPT